MNLYDEELQKNKKDNTKLISRIILVTIVILFIMLVIAIGLLVTLPKENKFVAYLDNEANNELTSIVLLKNGKVYMPIKEFATKIGYASYNGNPDNKSESSSECYAESDDELVSFTLKSDKIYKKLKNATDYDELEINEPVESIDGVLYTTTDGIEKAFNVSCTYSEEENKIFVYTMNYLQTYYKQRVLDLGFTDISEDFEDQKAIFNSLVIAKKSKYGLVKLSSNENEKDEIVLEDKYDAINYIPVTGDFLVKSNGKSGIIRKDGKTKIGILYDSIELINKNTELYVVKKDNKYGILDSDGKTIVSVDYDAIGIDITKFKENGIKNKFLLAESLIPVKKDKLWALFDVMGNKVVDFKFDSFGYIASTNKDALNLLVIPDYNVIIACSNKKYTLINSSGELLWNGAAFSDVYMTKTSTETNYWIISNDKTYNAETQLDKIGVKKVTDEDESKKEEIDNNATNKNDINQNDNTNINSNNSTK